MLHAAFHVIYGIERNHLRQFLFMKGKTQIDAVHEMELPQLISVKAVNDLESRMQHKIAVIEQDQPQLTWIRRVWIGSAPSDLETAVIGVKNLYIAI